MFASSSSRPTSARWTGCRSAKRSWPRSTATPQRATSTSGRPPAMSDLDGILDQARALQPGTVELRRRLHGHPEVGLRLPHTQRTILEALGDLGLEVRTGTSVTSVVALLEGAGAGAAPVSAAFALHISTKYQTGTVSLRPGPLLASGDRLRITVRGRGGHASAPHHALDPVPVACEIVLALQTMITRRVSVFDPAVVTISRITAGTTHNVIPDSAEMLGTVRALSEGTREAVRAQATRVAEGVAAAHGASAEVEIEAGYPMTVNEPAAAEMVRRVAVDLIGEDRVTVLADPIMGSEDFSYVLRRVPGAMAFLGACPPGLEPDTAPSNHSTRVVFDEDALPVGVATYAGLALRHLAGALADVEGLPAQQQPGGPERQVGADQHGVGRQPAL